MTRTTLVGRWGFVSALALTCGLAITATPNRAHAQTTGSRTCTVTVQADGSLAPNADCKLPNQSTSTANPDLMVTHDLDGYRPARWGDNGARLMSASDYEKYRAQHPDAQMKASDDVWAENQDVCSNVGYIVRESIAIAADSNDMGVELDGIRNDLVSLGHQQNTASWGRRGSEVVSTTLLCLIPGVNILYCGGAAAQNFGNEMQGSAHDKANKINRHQSDLNARQSQLQLRGMLVTMRANVTWAKLVQPTCLRVHPDATLGPVSATSTPTSWGYWNQRPKRSR